MLNQNIEEINDTRLLTSIKELIENSKNNLAISVNAEMTMLYWSIGKQINEEIDIRNRTDSYGKKIVATLWRKLSEEYGASFSEKNLRRMMQFASVFNDNKLITELSRQLTWSHIKMLIPMTDSLKRNFYIEMSKLDRWSVRTLRERID